MIEVEEAMKRRGACATMRTIAAVAFIAVPFQPAAAASPEPASAFLTKLFTAACIPSLGQPAKVRSWAEQHHLNPVTSPAALGVFVGPGGNGGAWAVPSAEGSFALSMRGTTQACAVWARAADPSAVTADFKIIMEGVKRPGVVVRVDKDETSSGPSGANHALVYNVRRETSPTASYEFTLLTAERPGGAFQASMQAAKADAD